MTGKTKDRQIALRVTSDTIKRAERLVPLMQKRPDWAPFRMTASTVIRVALLKGLDVLEAEVKGGRRPKAAPSEARGSGAWPQNSAGVWDV
jgi:hypothetical protein